MDKAEKHKRKMQKHKESIDKKVAQATEERGVVIVLTGTGKGKSSSGFGTVIRALGHGYKVGIVQFIKGTWECGERNFLENQPNVEYHVMGTGFTWETQDAERDKQAAEAAWEKARKLLQDDTLHLVLLDELSYAIGYKWLTAAEVIDALQQRPKMQTVIITGRGATRELKDYADTVSEIKAEKHAFQAGVKAQKGIEW
ncbi:MAG: cob(I)yrinic acid a,c-diamide adenosyltransferase [Ketobacteraceae bacterium]|nr:cob(I)yrinic acid a,c-diamide adenosyltransferase [Ketobacteraceae bacterium]